MTVQNPQNAANSAFLPPYTISASLTQSQSRVPVMPLPVGPQPQSMVCPKCGIFMKTKIVYKCTNWTHCIACSIFCFGCVFCCWIPYVMKLCTRIEHYCTYCKHLVGSYKS